MGLFDIFNKNKSDSGKNEIKVEECFDITSDLLGKIFDLASRYSVDEYLLDTYSENKLDIDFINNARVKLEEALLSLGKSLDEYYNNEYTTVNATVEKDKTFSYSLDAIGSIFNNSLDLYLQDESVRNTLNLSYKKCNDELIKVKEILSDDKALQEFTGITPIEKVEAEVEEVLETAETNEVVEYINEESKEDTVVEVNSESSSDDEVDGDLIINTESFKVYFIRISRNEEDELNLNLCIENKLDKEAIVKIKEVSVNKTITEPVFNCSVSAKSMVYDKIVFKKDIDQLINFEGTFYIMDNATSEVIDEAKVSMFEEN